MNSVQINGFIYTASKCKQRTFLKEGGIVLTAKNSLNLHLEEGKKQFHVKSNLCACDYNSVILVVQQVRIV